MTTRTDRDAEMLWMRPRLGVTRLYTTYEAAVDAICIRLGSLD